MAGGKNEKEIPAPIVIKRIKKGGGGHHGGAWKVAYADFVTAMMAFFLLLWLLNVTTEDQKNAISNYFDPSHPKISNVVSGAGGLLGGLSMSKDGAMVSTVQPIVQAQIPDKSTRGALQGQTEGEDQDVENTRDMATELLEKELRLREDERFKKAADDLQKEIAKTPELQALQENILIDITPEGLRIQIVDDKGRSMFPLGSAQMYPFMRDILLKIAGVIKPLPNPVSVRGHTDSFKYKDPTRYDNWNLSADRAQSSRRVLVEGGLPEMRLENVVGRADRDHLDAKNPQSEKNRRISIVMLREKLDPKALAEAAKKKKENTAARAKGEGATKTGGQTDSRGSSDSQITTKKGLTIIDDTQGDRPAGSVPSAADGKPPVMGPAGEQPQRPLPTTPVSPSGFKRQPQVMVFGDEGDNSRSDALYSGPVQEPIVNKPPTIRTPVFKLDGDKKNTDAPAAPPAALPKSAAPNDSKTFNFDDVPVMTSPTKPSAPALSPEPAKPDAGGERKSLAF